MTKSSITNKGTEWHIFLNVVPQELYNVTFAVVLWKMFDKNESNLSTYLSVYQKYKG